MRFVLLTVAGAIGAPAVAQTTSTLMAGSTPVSQTVVMGQYNPASGTYAGRVDVSATPCPNVTYAQNIPVGEVRTPEEATSKAAPSVAKILTDIRASASKCPRK